MQPQLNSRPPLWNSRSPSPERLRHVPSTSNTQSTTSGNQTSESRELQPSNVGTSFFQKSWAPLPPTASTNSGRSVRLQPQHPKRMRRENQSMKEELVSILLCASSFVIFPLVLPVRQLSAFSILSRLCFTYHNLFLYSLLHVRCVLELPLVLPCTMYLKWYIIQATIALRTWLEMYKKLNEMRNLPSNWLTTLFNIL